MKNSRMLSRAIQKNGFVVVPGASPELERQDLLVALGTVPGAGRRGVLGIDQIARWACSPAVLKLVSPHTATAPRPVRAIYFDKSAKANWLVSWHQDLTIAVRERIDVPGFGPWSVKAGVTHVHAPASVLEQMLTVRLHFDDCNQTNGALRVLPGTHRFGRLSLEQIRDLRAAIPENSCCLFAGDILLMRPLLLHASGKSVSRGHRRVLHVEYGGSQLTGGLQWHEPSFRSAYRNENMPPAG